MNCPKFTADGKRCTLPVSHPNQCYHDNAPPKQVMTKAGLEAQQLVDAYQRPKLVLQRDPNCPKCHGRAYNELPDADFSGRIIDHSICSKCGGYLYSKPNEQMSYATKKDKISNAPLSKFMGKKTHSGKNETEDLTRARLAEELRRRAHKRNTSQSKAHNYLSEAMSQADRDVAAISLWNGF